MTESEGRGEDEQGLVFRGSLEQRLACVVHRPLGGGAGAGESGVVLCHGMESGKDGAKHVDLARRLASRGILALRFDFTSCGESEGEFEEITFTQEVSDAAAAVAFARSLGVRRLGLFGSSMGGAVALLHAGADPSIACVVTLAAVAHPGSLALRFLPGAARIRPDEVVHLGSGRRVRGRFFLDALAQDVVGAARRVRAPTLVVHGLDDEVVPVADACDLADALGGPRRLSLLPRADHRVSDPGLLANVLEEATAWFAEHLRSGPPPPGSA